MKLNQKDFDKIPAYKDPLINGIYVAEFSVKQQQFHVTSLINHCEASPEWKAIGFFKSELAALAYCDLFRAKHFKK